MPTDVRYTQGEAPVLPCVVSGARPESVIALLRAAEEFFSNGDLQPSSDGRIREYHVEIHEDEQLIISGPDHAGGRLSLALDLEDDLIGMVDPPTLVASWLQSLEPRQGAASSESLLLTSGLQRTAWLVAAACIAAGEPDIVIMGQSTAAPLAGQCLSDLRLVLAKRGFTSFATPELSRFLDDTCLMFRHLSCKAGILVADPFVTHVATSQLTATDVLRLIGDVPASVTEELTKLFATRSSASA